MVYTQYHPATGMPNSSLARLGAADMHDRLNTHSRICYITATNLPQSVTQQHWVDRIYQATQLAIMPVTVCSAVQQALRAVQLPRTPWQQQEPHEHTQTVQLPCIRG
jgi:hypothetical protein